MRSLEGALTAQPDFRKDVAENAGALDSPKGADTRDDGDEVSVLEVRATVCLFFRLFTRWCLMLRSRSILTREHAIRCNTGRDAFKHCASKCV